MKRPVLYLFVCFLGSALCSAQSGRVAGYSESVSEKHHSPAVSVSAGAAADGDVIRVETDLVTLPVRVSERGGRPVTGIGRSEFKIFENDVEQEIAYFSADDQPFTVALALDMSYSSVFKLNDIQTAAKIFVSQLRPSDRVMVVSFAEKSLVLCEPTNDRKALGLAIDGSRIASGTSLYDTFGVLKDKLRAVPGRKAIIVLTDGVDTTSARLRSTDVERLFTAGDVIVYPIQYATFDDVRESRRKDAEIRYDDNDKPYVVQTPPTKGQRESDYAEAEEFLAGVASISGGGVFRVTSGTNLAKAFSQIAEELRKIYSLGYYPTSERRPGAEYHTKVRIYRPNLTIRTRENYSVRSR